MPHKNREHRLGVMAKWRGARSVGYHRWLYERRKLRFENAERFREAITAALRQPDEAEQILWTALDDAKLREIEVGNRYDHNRDESYWREDPASRRPDGVVVPLRKGGEPLNNPGLLLGDSD